MNRSITTPRGMLTIRGATPADAMPYRELRLEALQDSPIAFSADYEQNLSPPVEFWKNRLTMEEDESTLFLAEDEARLIGATGIARGTSPKTRHSARALLSALWFYHLWDRAAGDFLRWTISRRVFDVP